MERSHRDSFCDWQPLRPHPVSPCKGGCKVLVDAEDGFCNRCRKGAAAIKGRDAEPCRALILPARKSA